MLFLNLNKPFVNFDSLIDTAGLLSLKPQISKFIAYNFHCLKPTKYLTSNFNDTTLKGVYDYQFATTLYSISTDEIAELIATDKFGNFIIFEEDVVVGSMTLALRYSASGYAGKHQATNCASITEDQQFKFFYDWLEAQHIFTDYGRVALFVNFSGTNSTMHKDSSDRNNDQFILINFTDKKKFYMYDKDTDEKVYASGTCNWFNTGNWHGADTVEQACYTLRVDGVFTDEMLAALSKSNA